MFRLGNRITKSISELGAIPRLFLVFSISLLTIFILIIFKLVESTVLIGFLGVIIGSGISAFTILTQAKEGRRGSLAVASLEKRLEAHQAGYALWRKIIFSIHDDDRLAEVIPKADCWWDNHCLYLDRESRESMKTCISSASFHKDLLFEPPSKERTIRLKENFAKIMKPGETLVKGVYLPPLHEDLEPIPEPNNEGE